MTHMTPTTSFRTGDLVTRRKSERGTYWTSVCRRAGIKPGDPLRVFVVEGTDMSVETLAGVPLGSGAATMFTAQYFTKARRRTALDPRRAPYAPLPFAVGDRVQRKPAYRAYGCWCLAFGAGPFVVGELIPGTKDAGGFMVRLSIPPDNTSCRDARGVTGQTFDSNAFERVPASSVAAAVAPVAPVEPSTLTLTQAEILILAGSDRRAAEKILRAKAPTAFGPVYVDFPENDQTAKALTETVRAFGLPWGAIQVRANGEFKGKGLYLDDVSYAWAVQKDTTGTTVLTATKR